MRRSRPEEEPLPRIAVDTAVWLGGLLRGGPAEELIKLAITGKVKLLTSEALIADLVETVIEKLQFSELGTQELVKFVRECAEVVAMPQTMNGIAAGTDGRDMAHSPINGVDALNGHPGNGVLVAFMGDAPSAHGMTPAAGGPIANDPVLLLARHAAAGVIATLQRPELTKLGQHFGIPIVEID